MPGGAITRRAQSSDGSCERANILKSLTTLTTSLATSRISAGPAKRSKMILKKPWQCPPPQVATTRRVPEHHLVLLRRRVQVISWFYPRSSDEFPLDEAEKSIDIKLPPEGFTHNIQSCIQMNYQNRKERLSVAKAMYNNFINTTGNVCALIIRKLPCFSVESLC